MTSRCGEGVFGLIKGVIYINLTVPLNALYRSERWFDFERIVSGLSEDEISSSGMVGLQIRELAVKVFMKIRRLDRAQELLSIARNQGDDSFELSMCEASIDAMEARFSEARTKLEGLNRQYPMTVNVLQRLVLVCEQGRDYEAAAGFLRVALKIVKDDDKLIRKRQQYENLGVW